jgi:TRAP-type C4-dicarboxylate transport system substrate-binding protein
MSVVAVLAGCGAGNGAGKTAPGVVDTEAATSRPGIEAIKPIRLRIADIAPDSSPQGQAFRVFAEHVTRASGGRITFDFFWNSSLLAVADVPPGIGAGIADLGFILPGLAPEFTPIVDWIQGLGSAYDPSFPVGTLQAVGAQAEVLLDNAAVQEEFHALNLQLLTPLATTQFFDATCTKPVRTLADAKGTTIRTATPTHVAEVKALGMVPVNLVASEMFESLQRGIVDCVVLWPPIGIPLSIWDVAKDYTPIQFSGFNGYYMVINRDVWDGFPPVARQIIWDEVAVYVRTYLDASLAFYRRWGTEGPRKGLTFHSPSPDLAATLRGYQDRRVATMASTAPRSVANPQALVDAYLGALAKWRGIVVDDLGYPVFDDSAGMTSESLSRVVDLGMFQTAIAERIYEPRRPRSGTATRAEASGR